MGHQGRRPLRVGHTAAPLRGRRTAAAEGDAERAGRLEDGQPEALRDAAEDEAGHPRRAGRRGQVAEGAHLHREEYAHRAGQQRIHGIAGQPDQDDGRVGQPVSV